MNRLSFDMQVRVVTFLVEGSSIRSTERMTGVHRDTIDRLLLSVGEGCARLHDRMMRDLRCGSIQMDEIWGWVHTKQGHIPDGGDDSEIGDQWTFIAWDVPSRAIISHLTGKRTGENAEGFLMDLRARVLGKPVLASDGFKPYVNAVERAFGADVAFGMLVKVHEGDATGAREGHYKGAVRVPVVGPIDHRDINTSYSERGNLTVRMSQRRWTRKVNAFSKKLRHHCAAMALHVAHYNLVRVHETLRCTPAMQLGVVDRLWSVEDLVRAALAEPAAPPVETPPPPPPASQLALAGMPRLRLIQGGKA